MKRIFAVFMIAIMLCLFSVAVFAEGEVTDTPGAPAVDIAPEGPVVTPEQTPPEPEVSAPNVFDRLWEYVLKNKDMTAELIFSTAILVILWTIKKIQNGIKTDLKTSNSNSANVADSQSGVVGVVNTMIDGYNGFRKDFETTIKSDEERDKQMAAILVTNTAILEIMSRVFPNSKQLPQGVKDVVNMTYANAVKIINDDQQLANLVANSKNLLAAGTEKAASDEEAV